MIKDIFKLRIDQDNSFYVDGLVGFINEDLTNNAYIDKYDIHKYSNRSFIFSDPRVKELNLLKEEVTMVIDDIDVKVHVRKLIDPNKSKYLKISNKNRISLINLLWEK